jgi:hypothetical protein
MPGVLDGRRFIRVRVPHGGRRRHQLPAPEETAGSVTRGILPLLRAGGADGAPHRAQPASTVGVIGDRTRAMALEDPRSKHELVAHARDRDGLPGIAVALSGPPARPRSASHDLDFHLPHAFSDGSWHGLCIRGYSFERIARMTGDTRTDYFVLREGAAQEEALGWSDIEAMCRTGQLTPESLVFMPEENCWKKIAETALSGIFEERGSSADPLPEDAESQSETASEYRTVLEQIAGDEDNMDLRLQAARLAHALGDAQAVRDHLQQTLTISPYHPRIAQEARRMLPPGMWKTLRHLEKPASPWEDPMAIIAYPLSRGPLYLIVPSVVVAGMLFIPHAFVLVQAILYLWITQTIHRVSAGRKLPPLWRDWLEQPRRQILVPLLGAGIVGMELFGPFLLVAELVILLGQPSTSSAILLIQKSPMMLVPMFTLGIIYLPAALMMIASSPSGLRDVVDPRRVVSLIFRMEQEYLLTLAIVLLMTAAWWVMNLLFDFIPVLGDLLSVTTCVFEMLACGALLGKLWARTRDEME